MIYKVVNGIISEKTTLDEVKNSGLRGVCEITVKSCHAVKYTDGGTNSSTQAVMIYAPDGYDFIGERA